MCHAVVVRPSTTRLLGRLKRKLTILDPACMYYVCKHYLFIRCLSFG